MLVVARHELITLRGMGVAKSLSGYVRTSSGCSSPGVNDQMSIGQKNVPFGHQPHDLPARLLVTGNCLSFPNINIVGAGACRVRRLYFGNHIRWRPGR